MKVKEIDYTQYEYRRISVNNHHGVETFGLGATAEFLLERYGEEDLAEETPIYVNDDGLLIVTLAQKDKA